MSTVSLGARARDGFLWSAIVAKPGNSAKEDPCCHRGSARSLPSKVDLRSGPDLVFHNLRGIRRRPVQHEHLVIFGIFVAKIEVLEEDNIGCRNLSRVNEPWLLPVV